MMFVCVVGIPILLGWLFYRFLVHKGFPKIALLMPLIPIAVLAYIFANPIYPLDRTYKSNFESNVGMAFPQSGNIIGKRASLPNFDGEGWSEGLVRLSTNDYENVLLIVKRDSLFAEKEQKANEKGKKIFLQVPNENIEKIYGNDPAGHFWIGFMRDKKRIVVYSWTDKQ